MKIKYLNIILFIFSFYSCFTDRTRIVTKNNDCGNTVDSVPTIFEQWEKKRFNYFFWGKETYFGNHIKFRTYNTGFNQAFLSIKDEGDNFRFNIDNYYSKVEIEEIFGLDYNKTMDSLQIIFSFMEANCIWKVTGIPICQEIHTKNNYKNNTCYIYAIDTNTVLFQKLKKSKKLNKLNDKIYYYIETDSPFQ